MASVKVKGVLAKIETTYKTDAAPLPTEDAVQVEENFWGELEVGYLEENRRENLASGGMGLGGSAPPSGRSCRLRLAVAVKGCSTAFAAANLPELDALARCSGWEAVLDASPGSETYTLKTRSSGFESATIHAYAANALYKVVGCHGVSRIMFAPNTPVMLLTEISGVLVEDPSEAALPAMTYAQRALIPPVVKNAALSVHGYGPSDFGSFELDMRTVLVEKPRGNDPDGHAGYEITDRDPLITTTIDKPDYDVFNPFTISAAGTLGAVSMGPIGTVQYNQVALSAPTTRIPPLQHEEDQLLAMLGLPFECHNATQDDDVSITIS